MFDDDAFLLILNRLIEKVIDLFNCGALFSLNNVNDVLNAFDYFPEDHFSVCQLCVEEGGFFTR